MNMEKLAKQIESGKFKEHLQQEFSPDIVRRLGELSADELTERLNQVIGVPINLSGEMSHELLELYYTASWYNIFEDRGLPRNMSVFEIGWRYCLHTKSAERLLCRPRREIRDRQFE